MSLDLYLYLYGEEKETKCECQDCGNIHTRSEWPGLWWGDITHNLNRMADEAGIYQVMWRPDENGIFKASQLIEPLEGGLKLLEADPERFIKFNPSNGWGNYEGLVQFVKDVLTACCEYPDASVYAGR